MSLAFNGPGYLETTGYIEPRSLAEDHKVLIACERSGAIRRELRARGVNAWSNDLEPAEDGSEFHIIGDAREVAYRGGWAGMVAHPECRYLCGSGLHWNARRPERAKLTEEAIQFATDLWNAPVAVIAMENSVGILSTRLREPDEVIQPYDFGEDASKGTAWWLKGLPILVPTQRRTGRFVHNGKGRFVERWSNQTDSGQNRLPPSEERSMDRARTYPGIAAAVAEQWGRYLAGSLQLNQLPKDQP